MISRRSSWTRKGWSRICQGVVRSSNDRAREREARDTNFLPKRRVLVCFFFWQLSCMPPMSRLFHLPEMGDGTEVFRLPVSKVLLRPAYRGLPVVFSSSSTHRFRAVPRAHRVPQVASYLSYWPGVMQGRQIAERAGIRVLLTDSRRTGHVQN